MSVDPPPLPPNPAEHVSEPTEPAPAVPRDALESAAAPDQPLPDVPVARPILAESLCPAHLRADTLSSSIVSLTPWRAILQLILLVGAAIAGIILGSVLVIAVKLPDPRWEQMIIMAFAGVACILASFAMVRSVGQQPAAIGWRFKNVASDVGLGISVALGVYAVMMAVAMFLVLIRPDLMEDSTKAQRAIEATIPRASVPVMVLMMAFVALWEEVVFRGFLLTRLFVLFKKWWLTVLAGGVLFSLGHGYQGEIATLVIACVGVLLGTIFVWRRSLVPAIAFHMVFNLIGLLLLRSQSTTWQ